MMHLPLKTRAREFAYPAPVGAMGALGAFGGPFSLADVDLAFVYQEPLDRLGTITAHEASHLFGADDLCPLDVFDAGDTNDIMRASCLGFGAAKVRDMTAYAIGWRATPRTGRS